MNRSRHTLLLALLLLSSLRSFAQLGPLNWTGPQKVDANNIAILWHDYQEVGAQTHLKVHDFNFQDDALPVDERVTAYPSQEDGRPGGGAFTDAATGTFAVEARENLVSIWGSGTSGISIMVPRFDTTASMWSTGGQDSIVGDIQNDRIYVRTLDVDGDGLDEFIVAYLDNSDSIRFNLYDVDSLLQPTLTASYCDRKIPASVGNRVRYWIGTGDLNGDGDDEIALVVLDGFANFYAEVTMQLYDHDGSTLVPKADHQVMTSYGPPIQEFELAAVAGDYIADAGQELAIAMTLRHGSGGNNRTAHIQVFDISPDLQSITEGSYYTPTIPALGGITLGLATGDLIGDARDEIVLATGKNIRILTPTVGDSLEFLPAFVASPASAFGNDATRAMHEFIAVSDVDQDGRRDIIATYDIIGSGNSGFCTSIFSVDSAGVVDLIGALHFDEAQPTPGSDPPDHEFRPYSMVAGNFDGLNFTIGEPAHYVAHGVVQPIVILNAPPVHFDMLDSTLYDVNECYNGSACDFGASYRKQTTTSVEVTTKVQSDWVISNGIQVSGQLTVNVSPFGVGGSVATNYDNHMMWTYGEHFDNDTTNTTTFSIGVEVTAKEDDRIYSTVTDYDVWEYPLYHGNETFPRNTILAFVPLNVAATWFPSKSYNAVNYVPDHEVGNVLSYPAYADLEDNPNLVQSISADYNNDSFVLDASSDYDWFLTMNDFQSFGADSVIESGWDLAFDIAIYRHTGDFNESTAETHRTSVTELIDLNVHLGSVDMGIGDAKYTVTPYAYWGKNRALVVDYAAKPELAPPGFPETWWQTQYGQLPDPTFILPWKLDPEKGFAISEPAKREQTKDIFFSPSHPIAGDTVTITARVRNFSLTGTLDPVNVSFYLGDPEAGGTPLIGLSGTNVVSTTAPIVAQGREDVHIRWILPETQENWPRIYAVLDEDGSIDEIHEENNMGFNVLDWGSGTVGITEPSSGMNDGYALGQCYPNPFTSETIIEYAIPVASRTTILVFDQTGREVATLMDENLQAGTHSIIFDGSQLTAGVYFCSMRAGAYHEVRKMMLTR